MEESVEQPLACSSCGAERSATAAFCPACGTAVGRRCERCGTIASPGAQFCGGCGTDLAPARTGIGVSAPPVALTPAALPPTGGAARSGGGGRLAAAAAGGVGLLAVALIGVTALLARPAGPVPGPGAGSPTPGFVATPQVEDDPGELQQLVLPFPLEEGDVPLPSEPTTPITGRLSLGQPTQPLEQTIGSAGGTMTVTRPGDPLDGLRLDVPGGAVGADTRFTVTARPVTGSDFGPLVTPAGPLVSVQDGGGYADDLMTLRIPAVIPAGAVAGAFFYDEATGRLEGVPVVAVDATGVTVATRHFSSLLATIATGGLPDTVDSGFRPGADDWQFTNLGSFIEPGGHCSGQAVSAMYYYTERHLAAGAAALFGAYDNNGAPTKTPTFWIDDSDGYRLASMVQHDTSWDSWAAKLFTNSEKTPDAIHRMALRYAMAVTGEPQQILIYDANGAHGHAITAYRVTKDRVFVADPNYPGRLRTIRWDEATQDLLPYASGSNAADIAANGAVIYEQILYSAKSAIADWGAIGQRWAEFDAGTIGDGTFPGLLLEALAGKDARGKDVWAPLVDGYRTTEKKLTVRLRDPSAPGSVTMRIWRGASTSKSSPWGSTLTIDLEDGDNPLGIAEFRMADTKWKYVDFRRLTVSSGESTDWELAEVLVRPGSRDVTGDSTFVAEGDGRGGISTTWATTSGTPSSARVDATWSLPDRLAPGREVAVTAGARTSTTFESQLDSFCADGMAQGSPEDGSILVAALNETGSAPSGAYGSVSDENRSNVLWAPFGCDAASGKVVRDMSASGAFTVPARLVPAAGEAAFLVVAIEVRQFNDSVVVLHVYR